DERNAVRGRSPVGGKYDQAVNRDSAYEMLNKRAEQNSAAPPGATRTTPSKSKAAPEAKPAPEQQSKLDEFLWGTKRRQGVVETAAKSAARSVSGSLGRQILRGVLGGIFGGRR